MTGCGSKKGNRDNKNVVNPINISVSINYPATVKKTDLENFKFKAEEGSSVLEATELYGSITQIPILVDTTNNQIEGINSVINNYTIKGFCWKYSVNGSFVETNPQDLKLKDGDIVKWIYKKASDTNNENE